MENEGILKRIKALLNMTTANGCTEEEATRAAETAQDLLAKYNLSEDFVKHSQAGKVDMWDIEYSPSDVRWKGILLFGIARCNYAYCWFQREDDPEDSVYRVAGKEHNVDVVRQMYDYLIIAIKRQQRLSEGDHFKTNGIKPGRKWKESFLMGCAGRVQQRLLEKWNSMREDGTDDGTPGLVVVKSHLVAEDEIFAFMRRMGWSDVNFDGKKGKVRGDAGYYAGMDAAEKIGLGGETNAVGSGAKALGGR